MARGRLNASLRQASAARTRGGSAPAVGGLSDAPLVDIFDTSDYEFLLSRRAKRAIVFALLVGIAYVLPLTHWYLG